MIYNIHDIEDEFHFLWKCEVYTNLRWEMFNNAENNRNGFSNECEEDKFPNIILETSICTYRLRIE